MSTPSGNTHTPPEDVDADDSFSDTLSDVSEDVSDASEVDSNFSGFLSDSEELPTVSSDLAQPHTICDNGSGNTEYVSGQHLRMNMEDVPLNSHIKASLHTGMWHIDNESVGRKCIPISTCSRGDPGDTPVIFQRACSKRNDNDMESTILCEKCGEFHSTVTRRSLQQDPAVMTCQESENNNNALLVNTFSSSVLRRNDMQMSNNNNSGLPSAKNASGSVEKVSPKLTSNHCCTASYFSNSVNHYDDRCSLPVPLIVPTEVFVPDYLTGAPERIEEVTAEEGVEMNVNESFSETRSVASLIFMDHCYSASAGADHLDYTQSDNFIQMFDNCSIVDVYVEPAEITSEDKGDGGVSMDSTLGHEARISNNALYYDRENGHIGNTHNSNYLELDHSKHYTFNSQADGRATSGSAYIEKTGNSENSNCNFDDSQIPAVTPTESSFSLENGQEIQCRSVVEAFSRAGDADAEEEEEEHCILIPVTTNGQEVTEDTYTMLKFVNTQRTSCSDGVVNAVNTDGDETSYVPEGVGPIQESYKNQVSPTQKSKKEDQNNTSNSSSVDVHNQSTSSVTTLRKSNKNKSGKLNENKKGGNIKNCSRSCQTDDYRPASKDKSCQTDPDISTDTVAGVWSVLSGQETDAISESIPSSQIHLTNVPSKTFLTQTKECNEVSNSDAGHLDVAEHNKYDKHIPNSYSQFDSTTDNNSRSVATSDSISHDSDMERTHCVSSVEGDGDESQVSLSRSKVPYSLTEMLQLVRSSINSNQVECFCKHNTVVGREDECSCCAAYSLEQETVIGEVGSNAESILYPSDQGTLFSSLGLMKKSIHDNEKIVQSVVTHRTRQVRAIQNKEKEQNKGVFQGRPYVSAVNNETAETSLDMDESCETNEDLVTNTENLSIKNNVNSDNQSGERNVEGYGFECRTANKEPAVKCRESKKEKKTLIRDNSTCNYKKNLPKEVCCTDSVDNLNNNCGVQASRNLHENRSRMDGLMKRREDKRRRHKKRLCLYKQNVTNRRKCACSTCQGCLQERDKLSHLAIEYTSESVQQAATATETNDSSLSDNVGVDSFLDESRLRPDLSEITSDASDRYPSKITSLDTGTVSRRTVNARLRAIFGIDDDEELDLPSPLMSSSNKGIPATKVHEKLDSRLRKIRKAYEMSDMEDVIKEKEERVCLSVLSCHSSATEMAVPDDSMGVRKGKKGKSSQILNRHKSRQISRSVENNLSAKQNDSNCLQKESPPEENDSHRVETELRVKEDDSRHVEKALPSSGNEHTTKNTEELSLSDTSKQELSTDAARQELVASSRKEPDFAGFDQSTEQCSSNNKNLNNFLHCKKHNKMCTSDTDECESQSDTGTTDGRSSEDLTIDPAANCIVTWEEGPCCTKSLSDGRDDDQGNFSEVLYPDSHDGDKIPEDFSKHPISHDGDKTPDYGKHPVSHDGDKTSEDFSKHPGSHDGDKTSEDCSKHPISHDRDKTPEHFNEHPSSDDTVKTPDCGKHPGSHDGDKTPEDFSKHPGSHDGDKTSDYGKHPVSHDGDKTSDYGKHPGSHDGDKTPEDFHEHPSSHDRVKTPDFSKYPVSQDGDKTPDYGKHSVSHDRGKKPEDFGQKNPRDRSITNVSREFSEVDSTENDSGVKSKHVRACESPSSEKRILRSGTKQLTRAQEKTPTRRRKPTGEKRTLNFEEDANVSMPDKVIKDETLLPHQGTAHRKRGKQQPSSDEVTSTNGCKQSPPGHEDKKITGNKQSSRHSLRSADSQCFSCSVCKRKFYTANEVTNHMKIHTEKKKHKCPLCPRAYTQKGAVKLHIDSHHDGKKPFKCSFCEKSFRQKVHLKTHVRSHTGEKPYQCDQCDKSFTRRDHLQAHTNTHSAARPYQCKICPLAFKCYSNLTKHMRIHLGDRRYRCDLCGATFILANTLRMHHRVHTGEKPLHCPVCKTYFRFEANFRKHIIANHPEFKIIGVTLSPADDLL